MDRPQIIVFTNTYPDWLLMTADRWEVWDMDEAHALVRHAHEGNPDQFAPMHIPALE